MPNPYDSEEKISMSDMQAEIARYVFEAVYVTLSNQMDGLKIQFHNVFPDQYKIINPDELSSESDKVQIGFQFFDLLDALDHHITAQLYEQCQLDPENHAAILKILLSDESAEETLEGYVTDMFESFGPALNPESNMFHRTPKISADKFYALAIRSTMKLYKEIAFCESENQVMKFNN